jgi:hypothetical protein
MLNRVSGVYRVTESILETSQLLRQSVNSPLCKELDNWTLFSRQPGDPLYFEPGDSNENIYVLFPSEPF